MDALKFDLEGGDIPIREPEAQAFDSDLFEGKTRGLVEELVKNRSVEAQVLRDRLRIYKP